MQKPIVWVLLTCGISIGHPGGAAVAEGFEDGAQSLYSAASMDRSGSAAGLARIESTLETDDRVRVIVGVTNGLAGISSAAPGSVQAMQGIALAQDQLMGALADEDAVELKRFRFIPQRGGGRAAGTSAAREPQAATITLEPWPVPARQQHPVIERTTPRRRA